MASMSLMLRLAFKHSLIHGDTTLSVLKLSRFTSLIMLIAYGAYLFFQLTTHRQIFDQGQVFFLLIYVQIVDLTLVE